MSDVAKTILSQLGGNKFIAMTGAKDILLGKDSLYFRINGRSPSGKRINRFLILLQGNDLYYVQADYVRGANGNTLSYSYDVGVEQLAETFERLTQLRTRL